MNGLFIGMSILDEEKNEWIIYWNGWTIYLFMDLLEDRKKHERNILT